MADRYRSQKGRKQIHPRVDTDTIAYLNNIAGEMSIGWAIEKIANDHKRLMSDTKVIPNVALVGRIN